MNAVLTPTRRVRRTPFSAGVEAAGAKGYTVYNHMLLPSIFESNEADYHHLKKHVQVWDVACERQVELRGPDAGRLMQFMTPRDLSRLSEERCFYIPVVDEAGGMLNDPVALKLAADRYWISLADSDLLLWAKGLALGLRLDVSVFEPDVSPLGVQGPKADELMARVFGEAVRGLRFFGCGRFAFEDRELLVARSGYSKQGGFEIYVEGSEIGMPLWDALMAAGTDLEVRAGGPNGIERIEAGLLSYGSDMTSENTPFECGLGRFCHVDAGFEFVGKEALQRAAAKDPARQIRPIAITSGRVPSCDRVWPLLSRGQTVGQLTSAAWSPDFGVNVAIGMVDRTHWTPGTKLEVITHDGPFEAVVQNTFWI